ncbi:MAG: glutamate-1-semialdehyde 2,1-aminomutase [bacterium]|nr:glutamate-1-semialdehyde 2,1-aminomutase [bacterium]
MTDHTYSKKLYKKAVNYMPGGVNSPVRAFLQVGGVPIFIKRAEGAHLFDEDGNEYIDYVNSWGPSILGHANPKVVEAVRKAALDGFTFGAPTRKENELASLIAAAMPDIKMMRFVNSGTEAAMSAIRVARGYTGREYIVKFNGCYHGHSDGLLIKAGSGVMTASKPGSAGVLKSYTKTTLQADYNNKEQVRELFKKYKEKIAAVIIEPVAANMGLVAPEVGFLEFLRDITYENETVLIFDEVITGFRLGLGGASEYYHISPDLICLGKIIGGGLPMGLYGGKKCIMEQVAPLGDVYQAGTLSGNPIATTAGIATLKQLFEHKEKYQEMEENAVQITDALKTAYPYATVNRVGSLYSIFFTKGPVMDYATANTSDLILFRRYFQYLLGRGIYVAPSQFEINFLSMAHSKEDINQTCHVILESGKEL